MVLLFFFGLGHATSIAKRETGQCPVIHQKPKSECQGRVSECWLPGTFDMDCSNGAELCCFDGCVTMCGPPKVCKTVYEPKTDIVKKEQCEFVPQPPVCVTVTSEECNDVTETVEEVVRAVIDDTVCTEVNEDVCEPFEAEVCVPPSFFESNTTCPVVEAKPAEECAGLPASVCWSPGVPDLDCENSALCCFDGCRNQCVKKAPVCHKVMEDSCREVEVENCEEVPELVCNKVEKPVIVPLTTTICNKVGVSCMKMQQTVCDNGLDDCEVTENEVCTQPEEESCETIQKEQSSILAFSQCERISKRVCRNIPKTQCEKVEKEVCEECQKTKVINHRCKTVPKQNCEQITKTVENFEPRAVTRQECSTVDKQECKDQPPENVCTQVEVPIAYDVPVLVCEQVNGSNPVDIEFLDFSIVLILEAKPKML